MDTAGGQRLVGTEGVGTWNRVRVSWHLRGHIFIFITPLQGGYK